MMDVTYARAYARALFSLAKAQGIRDATAADIFALKAQWEGSQELRRFASQRLKGNTQTHEHQIDELWGTSFSSHVIQLLKVLAHRSHLRLIPAIIKAFQALLNRDLKCEQIVSTFALDPDAPQLTKLRSLIASAYGENYNLIVKTDPRLIAGFKMILNDTCIDASLSGRLNRLKMILKKPALAG